MQLTWTARMALTVADIQPAGEVVVSYLPLSHVAAQMFDMWMCASLGLTTYFADPDALKVGERPDLVVVRPVPSLDLNLHVFLSSRAP